MVCLNDLPPSERKALELLAEGRTNKQIALALGRSVATVGNQLNTLYLRIGVTNRYQAMRWYLEQEREAA